MELLNGLNTGQHGCNCACECVFTSTPNWQSVVKMAHSFILNLMLIQRAYSSGMFSSLWCVNTWISVKHAHLISSEMPSILRNCRDLQHDWPKDSISSSIKKVSSQYFVGVSTGVLSGISSASPEARFRSTNFHKLRRCKGLWGFSSKFLQRSTHFQCRRYGIACKHNF